eukprot:COSAG04_NODE_179_length_21356_cov_11.112998_3_plen_800_part_00
MQLARKVATYNRAAVTFQRLWRGHACRKQQQVLAKERKYLRRPKRDKDMSADMLLLRMSTAGDVSTEQLVKREKGKAGGLKGRFRMDPAKFRQGAGASHNAADEEMERISRAQDLMKRCLKRVAGEAAVRCFELWKTARQQAIEAAEREVEAPAMEAYEQATEELEREEWEAAAAQFALALKAGHPALWECNFLRGVACSRYGAADLAVKAFGAAIAAEGSRSAAWFNRGMSQMRLGLLEEAWADLKMTVKLDPFHSKAKEALKMLGKELQSEDRERKLPDIKRDGKAAYNVQVVGKYRVRPVAASKIKAFEEQAQLRQISGGATADRFLAEAGIARSGSFSTTISAAHHVPSAEETPPKTRNPDFSKPNYYSNPLGEIQQEFPVDAFNTDGDGDIDGDGDSDSEDEALLDVLGAFSAAEVELLDQGVLMKAEGDWEGVAEYVNEHAQLAAAPRRPRSAAAAAIANRAAEDPRVAYSAAEQDQVNAGLGMGMLRESGEQLIPIEHDGPSQEPVSDNPFALAPTASDEEDTEAAPDDRPATELVPLGAGAKADAEADEQAKALGTVIKRTAAECEAEWSRRVARYTAEGKWVGSGIDRRELNGRNTLEEAEIARQEMANRLRSLECHHLRSMAPSDPMKVYPRTNGAWFCDECGLPNPTGRMFHCSACDDYDLCAQCMRASKKATSSSGPNKWTRLQTDESLSNRVLGTAKANSRLAMGNLDLFGGGRTATVFNAYHNPYQNARVVHGVTMYSDPKRSTAGITHNRPIPGLDDELRAEERKKIAALGRAMRRRNSGLIKI